MKSVAAVGLAVVAAVAWAAPARAEVVTSLTGDVGCSLHTLGAGAVAADNQPGVDAVYVSGRVSGLTPGTRYTIAFPLPGHPGRATGIGRAGADGVVTVAGVRVPTYPLPDMRSPQYVIRVGAAGQEVVHDSVPLHVRPGAQCAVLSTLASWDYPSPPAVNYHLAQQTDGNVVERNGPTGYAVWSTGTAGHPGATTVMQSDGNVVTRDRAGRAIWNSGTAGHPGATMTVQIDDDIVVRDAAGRAIWKTGLH